MLLRCLIWLWLGSALAIGVPAAATPPADAAYAKLRAAYAAGDAVAAANAYTADAVYAELYAGQPPLLRSGQTAISTGFSDLFGQIGPPRSDRPIDLNFRLVTRIVNDGGTHDTGYYRLTLGRGRDAQVSYGRFATQTRDGLFRFDASSAASIEDFESAAGPTLFAPDDEVLAPAYYDRLLGTFGDGPCPVVITRSAWRLFALDACSGRWRGLSRHDGLTWSQGSQVVGGADGGMFRFVAGDPTVVVRQGPSGGDRRLTRQIDFGVTSVLFGADNRLAGSLYTPVGAETGAPRAAVVMLHGSGEQDRHGYASIVSVMAQRLARSGVFVLTYDKRGVGQSQGDLASAGFAELAADARDAMATLRAQRGVDPRRIAVAGSSQAGWVAAKLVETGGDPAGVFLLGAAGAAMTVAEQNLYNTRVLMQCAAIPADDIRLALDQQRAFFAARRDPGLQALLTRISSQASQRTSLADWLFPASAAPTPSPAWYDVLALDFDPLPVWQNYRGQAVFVFAANDDSTDTRLAVRRLSKHKHIRLVSLPGAHHLGLASSGPCDGDFRALDRFHPGLFPALEQWAKSL